MQYKPLFYNKVFPIIIGIAGGTGSGKSTFAYNIVKSIGKDNITIISHDSYYKGMNHLTLQEREDKNFDHPDSLETSLLIDHIKALKLNKSIKIPTYDFKTHCRLLDKEKLIIPKKIIIIEGILIFSNEELLNLLDIKVFVDISADIRILRRLKRDTTERNRTIDNIINQYITTVRPMHELYVEPSKYKADFIVPGINNCIAIDLIVTKINDLLNNKTFFNK